jgi:GAF domain-containing protein
LELIHSISEQMNSQEDRSARLQKLLEITLQRFGATSGCVIALGEDKSIRDGALAYGGQLQAHTTQQLLDIVESGLAGWVIEHHQPALIPSTIEDPRWLRRPWEERYQTVRSAICVPLVNREKILGVLTLVRPEAGHFTKEDLTLLTAIVTYASGLAAGDSSHLAQDQITADLLPDTV